VIYRIFPTADTWITNFKVGNVPQTASNHGASEIANLFVVAPTSNSLGYSSGSLSHILTKFDLSEITALTASLQAPSAGIQYRLRLKDAPHAQTLPSSYDVEVLPISQSWDEGNGLDDDDFTDLGYANWVRAKSATPWSRPGGDALSSPYSVSHFDQGNEDLSVDVTTTVAAWLSGTIANNGFMVRMSSSLESGSLDYFVKMFHMRHTNFADRMPYLEASWDDSVKDDRGNFVFDVTGSLFLYNQVRGAPTNLSTPVFVKISDASGTLMVLTGTQVGRTGVYSASFSLPTGSYSGSVFSDVWFSGSKSYMTGTFYPTDNFAQQSIDSGPFFVSVPNLKDRYESDESVRLKLFIRNRDYNPAVVLTASSGPTGLVATQMYYRIDNDRTDEVVVPFGTGSIETTRLSYNRDGNYFDFYMRSLPPKNVYRLVLLMVVDGRRQIVDRSWKFQVL
jgi:hypothetical protein